MESLTDQVLVDIHHRSPAAAAGELTEDASNAQHDDVQIAGIIDLVGTHVPFFTPMQLVSIWELWLQKQPATHWTTMHGIPAPDPKSPQKADNATMKSIMCFLPQDQLSGSLGSVDGCGTSTVWAALATRSTGQVLDTYTAIFGKFEVSVTTLLGIFNMQQDFVILLDFQCLCTLLGLRLGGCSLIELRHLQCVFRHVCHTWSSKSFGLRCPSIR